MSDCHQTNSLLVDNRIFFWYDTGMKTQIKDNVLTILKSEQNSFLSGEKIAQKLGVSRNAIWKAVRSLRQEGYEISSCTNSGYRLEKEQSLVIENSLQSLLKTDLPFVKVSVFDSLPSTNTYLKNLAEQGAEEGTVIVAHSQTAGRGRKGRSFHSPKGTGLYFSILLRPNVPFSQSIRITTTAAVCVCRAIERLFPTHVCQIKWVNDVYLNDRKICGILTEGAINAENGQLSYAILGVGINLTAPKGGFPKEIRSIAGAISTEKVNANSLLFSFLQEFFAAYAAIEQNPCITEYQARSFLVGKQVTVTGENADFAATVTRVNDDFTLSVIDKKGEEHTLSSGEVSVRPQ